MYVGNRGKGERMRGGDWGEIEREEEGEEDRGKKKEEGREGELHKEKTCMHSGLGSDGPLEGRWCSLC